MNQLQLLIKYFQYLLKSKSKHGIHSPFVYKFITEVLEDKRHFYGYEEVEKLRYRLLQSEEIIEITDFGAGSQAAGNNKKRKIKDIAKHAAKPAKYAQLLFRIVNHFQPKEMLEFGSSLGISTIYQALPARHARFITMEGCPQTAKIAKENIAKFNLENIELIKGNFDSTLGEALEKFSRLDYVFFDGNHRQEPTIRYFEQCLPFAHDDTVFIFDDIHWSEGMEKAWEYVKRHGRVKLTIDLFFVGIVFFRKEPGKQDFVVTF